MLTGSQKQWVFHIAYNLCHMEYGTLNKASEKYFVGYEIERLSLYGTMGVWNKLLPSKLFHYLDFSAKPNSTNSAT